MLKKIEFFIWSGLAFLFFILALLTLFKEEVDFSSGAVGGKGAVLMIVISALYRAFPEPFGRYFVFLLFVLAGLFFFFRARSTKLN